MRDHQKSWFPGTAEEGCFFIFFMAHFNVSSLSVMAVSEHKDVAPLSNLWRILSQYVVQIFHQITLDRPHNLVLMSVHLVQMNLLKVLLLICPFNPCNKRQVSTPVNQQSASTNMFKSHHTNVSQICAGRINYTETDQRAGWHSRLLPPQRHYLCSEPNHHFQYPEPDISKWFHPSRGIDWSSGRG